MQKFRAFSLAETLTALGIIGILCITMLSLNSMSDNKYKVATTKIAQVDSALKSWGKAVSKSNETGLGAIANIKNEEQLTQSLTEYFRTVGTQPSEDSKEIILNNGVTLSVKYTGNTASLASDTRASGHSFYAVNINDSKIAEIVASAEIPNSEPITEQYALISEGVIPLADLYEGWSKFEVKAKFDENGNLLYKYYVDNENTEHILPTINIPGENGETTTRYVEGISSGTQAEFGYVFIKVSETASCGYNQTGTTAKQTFGTADGAIDYTVNTCCTSPKTYVGINTDGSNKCSCQKGSVEIPAGYKFADNDECKAPCLEGSYEKEGICELCDVGHYCPNKAQTSPISCPKGSYCPNDLTANINNDYNAEKYLNKNGKPATTNANIKKVQNGGLIDKVICPAGSYCPDENMTAATKCPKGTYCPNQGMTAPIKCPAGTYGKKTGATSIADCLPCPAGNYCPNEGMSVTDLANFICDGGKYSLTGATACSVCPAGKFLKKTDKKDAKGNITGYTYSCEPCAKGHYSAEAGATACELCPAGTIQTKTGQSSCTVCSTGVSTDDRLLCGCVKGKYLELSTGACKLCPVGTYADEPGLINKCKACPNKASTSAEGSTDLGQCKCIAGYSLYSVDNAGAKTEAGTENGQEVLFTVDNKNKLQCMQTNCAYYSGANDNRQYYCGDYLKNNGSIPSSISSSNIADYVYGSPISKNANSCKARTSTQRFTDSNPVNHCGAKVCDANATLSEKEFIIGQNSTTPRKYTKCLCNKGYYGNGDTCTACPANSTTDGPGATSRNECKCIAGYSGNATTGACTICPKNQYKTGVGNASCSSCPDNSATNNQTGRTSIAQCKCNAGYAIYDGEFTYKGGNFTEENKNTVSCQLTNCAYYSPANDNTRHYCVNYIEGKTNEANIHKTTTMFNLGSTKLGSDFINKHKNEEVRDFVYGIRGQATGAAAKCGYRADNQRFTDSNPDNHCSVKTCNANATISADAFKISNGAKSTERKYTKCLCKAGYYGDGDTCTKCPAGTYKAEAGNGTQKEVCVSCQKGYYCPNAGMTAGIECPCGKYQDQRGQTACKTLSAGMYYNSTALQENKGITCTADKHATKEKYCPAGSCKQLNSCPNYGEIYMVTDGHGYDKTLDELLNTFTCISKNGLSQSDLNKKGSQTIFIIEKTGESTYHLISSGTLKTNINTLRTSYAYNSVFGAYTYSASGVTYGNTCGTAHGSSSSGGTLRYHVGGVDCEYFVKLLGKRVSPLILDLEGNGKNLTSLEDGVKFDLDADTEGIKEQTAWTDVQYTFDDAFLCLDRNGNGLIDDGSELFGDQHGSSNGFDELAKFDLNGDGHIDTADEAYGNLLLWVDFNKNGTVDYISKKDYTVFMQQTHNANDLKNNMDCTADGCHYYINKKKEVCDDDKILGLIPVKSCHTEHSKKQLDFVSPENGKTPELKTLADYNIDSLSVTFEELTDGSGNLLLDHHGNTVGMEGSFTQRVRVAAENAVDAMGNLLDGIVESAGNFFRSVVKSMTDVWFVTDNQ